MSHFCLVELNSIKCDSNSTVVSYIALLSHLMLSGMSVSRKCFNVGIKYGGRRYCTLNDLNFYKNVLLMDREGECTGEG